MKLKTNIVLAAVATTLLLVGCSKEIEEYNKPAIYWYTQLVHSVAKRDLEKADNYYASLQGEHIGSPLLPEATLILSIAHMHYKEYLLSEHFSNEYVKRYANANEREFADYMKIKAKYMALPNPRRDQVLMQEAIRDGEVFKNRYPNSMYYAIIDTMLTNLIMAEASLNESVANLYERLDKPRSAAYYSEKKPQSWIRWEEIDKAKTPWYREWFEGDGGDSWYSFLIPDTQSVVSRNTVQEEYISSQKEPSLQKNENFKEKLKKQNRELQKAKEMNLLGILSTEEYQDLQADILQGDRLSYYQDVQVLTDTKQDQPSKFQNPELLKAKALLEEGIINQEEFTSLKNEILK